MPFVAILLALAATGPSFNAADDRGLFVYGRLVLDFVRGREAMGHDAPLANCSNAAFHCADGELFNLVVPRACADVNVRPGTTWRVGALETTVIGRRGGWRAAEAGPMPDQPPDDIYYLQTNERPEVIYEYARRRGVTALFFDPRGDVDFGRMARNGDIEPFRRAIAGVAGREHLAMDLITFDSFAACRERAGGRR